MKSNPTSFDALGSFGNNNNNRSFNPPSTTSLLRSTVATPTSGSSAAIPSPSSSKQIQHPELSVVFEGTSVLAGDRILLDRATGMLRAGRLTAIVSACGSRGDFLMLQLLAGLEDPTSGTVIANCVPVSSETYRTSAAFVNTAILQPAAGASLSVLDNLRFSLRMRSENLSSDEVDARISKVFEQLQLQDVADHASCQLAAHNRAKLAIATELVLHPDFVFIDLNTIYTIDTPQLCDLLYLLGKVARDERIVVAVALVQPRWLLLEYFHDVLLMEHSRLYYCGTRENLLPLLYEAEALQPAGGSFSGHDTLAAVSGGTSYGNGGSGLMMHLTETNQQRPVRHPESCLNSLYILCASTKPSDILEPPGFAAARAKMANLVANHLRDTANGAVVMYEAKAGAGKHSPNSVAKLYYMTFYGLLRVKQRLITVVINFCLAFAAFLLIGKVYGEVMNGSDSSPSQTIQNASGLLFFAVSLAFLYNILHIEPFRQQLYSFQQHRSQGYYGGFLFLLWLVLSNGIARALFCLFFIVGLYIVDPLLSLTRLQHLIVVLGVVSFSTLAMAWAVLSLFPRSKQLTTVVFVAWYAVSALFGGLFINLTSLPETLQTVSFFSLIRLGFESVIVGQFADNNLGCNVTAPAQLSPSRPAASSSSTTGAPKHTVSQNLLFTTAAQRLDVENRVEDDVFVVRDNFNSFVRPCQTGDAFIKSVGFDLSRKWDNLLPVTYIFLVFLVVFCFGLWKNRKF